VATTLPETARQTDSQTDQHTPHQSEYNTLPTAPTPLVGSQPSGLSSHAQETCSETSSQLSMDPTIDLAIQEPFAEDSTSASTDTDICLNGLWEERPVLPGLNLPVAGASSHGAGQGMEPRSPSLVPGTAAASCRQAVDTVHPPRQTGTRGTGHSTRFWDDIELYTEPEQYSDHSTAHTHNQDPTLAPNWVSSHTYSDEAWDALNLLAMTTTDTQTTDKTQVQQQTELVANTGERVAMATKPSTDTVVSVMSVTVLSRVPDMDTPLATVETPAECATAIYAMTQLSPASSERDLRRSSSLPSLASSPTAPTRLSTLRIDHATTLLPQTSPRSMYIDLPTSLPFQTAPEPPRIDLTTPPMCATRQQPPHLDSATTTSHQPHLHQCYLDDLRPTAVSDVAEMHSAAACTISDNFLYCASTLGLSDKENHSVGFLSRHSDEGHASFVPDSSPLGDTDMLPTQTQTKNTVFTHSETPLTGTNKTVLADNSRTTKNGSHTHLAHPRSESRLPPCVFCYVSCRFSEGPAMGSDPG